jgi:hypothetical protein
MLVWSIRAVSLGIAFVALGLKISPIDICPEDPVGSLKSWDVCVVVLIYPVGTIASISIYADILI